MNHRSIFRIFLYILVTTLVFEGIVRKFAPGPISLLLFFLKDFLCIAILMWVGDAARNRNASKIVKWWQIIAIAMLPLIFWTAIKGFALGLFGAKQYLLYTAVAFSVPLAFPKGEHRAFSSFIGYLALLLIPTTAVAILQQKLGASHWLNQSVAGESLEQFSAGGYLRVASTFSFTAQYSYFLNASAAFVSVRLLIPPDGRSPKIYRLIPGAVLFLAMVVGAFITGGRTAVLGCGGVILIGFILSAIRAPKAFLKKGLIVGFCLVVALPAIRIYKPEFFAAYDQRAQGSTEETQTQELSGRMSRQLFGWARFVEGQDLASSLMGNGLGVMSNGSDKLSSYAKKIRSSGFWTETDQASTMWEGGLYLMVLWYGFRLMVIVSCLRMVLRIRHSPYVASAAFLFAYVAMQGLIGPLGIQSPLAIWWWLSVGLIFTLHGLDSHRIAMRRQSKLRKRQLQKREVEVVGETADSTGEAIQPI